MSTSIRQALQHVADYPEPVDDEVLQQPVHELVARTLFDIANRPDASVRGSLTRANKARKMILDRLTGKRRSGTKPHARSKVELNFIDLTGGELSAGQDDAPGAGGPGDHQVVGDRGVGSDPGGDGVGAAQRALDGDDRS